jgi:hypothetical protein
MSYPLGPPNAKLGPPDFSVRRPQHGCRRGLLVPRTHLRRQNSVFFDLKSGEPEAWLTPVQADYFSHG